MGTCRIWGYRAMIYLQIKRRNKSRKLRDLSRNPHLPFLKSGPQRCGKKEYSQKRNSSRHIPVKERALGGAECPLVVQSLQFPIQGHQIRQRLSSALRPMENMVMSINHRDANLYLFFHFSSPSSLFLFLTLLHYKKRFFSSLLYILFHMICSVKL